MVQVASHVSTIRSRPSLISAFIDLKKVEWVLVFRDNLDMDQFIRIVEKSKGGSNSIIGKIPKVQQDVSLESVKDKRNSSSNANKQESTDLSKKINTGFA